MGITSLNFIGFILAVLVLYYILPAKFRWPFLLICNLAYMCLSGEYYLVIYPLATVLAAWICTNRMVQSPDKKRLLYIALAANIGVLVIFKYLNLGVYTCNAFAQIFGGKESLLEPLRFAAPVGLSFYTMSVLSYIFDVYYEICEPEKNYFKLLMYGSYFPLLVSGPIVRYKDMSQKLFAGKGFDYKNLTYGAQRVLFGFFKVLVISERLSVVVAAVFEDHASYPGIYILLGITGFALQLYTNFSGSMDIIMGLSEALGIELPENFRQPFFSETVQEFWQRWHITLGGWLKDYVLYPILRTQTFMALPGKWKEKCGKKKAKQYTTFIAMAILWLISGLWHGGAWKYIWGTGMLQCLYIIIGETGSPLFTKIRETLHINEKSFGHRIFRKIRTFLLISVGFTFFNAGSLREGFDILYCMLRPSTFCYKLSDELAGLGLDYKEWAILLFSLLLLWLAELAQTKKALRERLADMPIVLRWILLYAGVYYVVIFGSYGPGYSAAQFIYQGF